MIDFHFMKFTKLFAFFLAMIGMASAVLKEGDVLPKIEAQNHLGKMVKIEPAKGSDYLLLFFYPKAMTGG